LEIKNLKTYFFLENSTVRAVDGVNLTLPRKSTLGVVGESGCGKSVMAMSVMRLIQSPPGKIVDGQIFLHRGKGSQDTVDIAQLNPRSPEMRDIRGGEIAIVFQEPMMSLNPLFRIGDQIAEAVQIHQQAGHKEAMERALEMLTKVQISAPKQRLNRPPVERRMRQRVMTLWRCRATHPSCLPTNPPRLDVTVNANSGFDERASGRF
jgi:ABC-type dipeptide/oligopeptide/nickel transport system ATPase component